MKGEIYSVKRYPGEKLVTCRGTEIGIYRKKKKGSQNGPCVTLTQGQIKRIYG